jgi:hypothetical protein
MPERGGDAKTITAPGVLYTNDGSDNPPAALGTLTALPSAVSYFDGFFFFPTQVLVRATPSESGGVTTPFVEGQPLDAYTSFVDLANTTLDFKRQILISGGFLNNMASADDPKTFVTSAQTCRGIEILDHLKIIDVDMNRMLVVVIVDEPPFLD